MYCLGRACVHTFLAQTAFVVVYISQIIVDCNCLELAFFFALAATYAGCFTFFHGHGSAVTVGTCHPDSQASRTFGSQFDQMAGTCFDTNAACSTFVFVYNRQFCLGIDV